MPRSRPNGLSGVADIGRANATVKGDLKAFDVTLAVAGPVTNASLAANIEPTPEEIRVGLQRFDGRYKGIPVALAAPAQPGSSGPRVTIEPAALPAGRRTARGRRRGRSRCQRSHASTSPGCRSPWSMPSRRAPASKAPCRPRRRSPARLPIRSCRRPTRPAACGSSGRKPRCCPHSRAGHRRMADRQASVDARLSAGGATSLGIKARRRSPKARPLCRSPAPPTSRRFRRPSASRCATLPAPCAPT